MNKRNFKKNISEKVDTFHKTILNILSNFIPRETLICDDGDPPWFNNKINLLYTKKWSILKFRRDGNNSFIKRQPDILEDCLISSTEASKQKYNCRMAYKLIITQKSSKAYLSLLKGFLSNKKIPPTPPLFHESRLITDFKEKA